MNINATVVCLLQFETMPGARWIVTVCVCGISDSNEWQWSEQWYNYTSKLTYPRMTFKVVPWAIKRNQSFGSTGASIPQKPWCNLPLHFPIPFSLFPSTLSFPPSPFPFPYLPLEVPLNPARRAWGAVSSPGGVWGGAPTEIEFGVF